MADYDATDKYRFETQEEAIAYAERIGKPGIVIQLSEAKYSDKPFMYVLQEWITGANKHE